MLTVILVVAMASFASAQQPPPAQTTAQGAQPERDNDITRGELQKFDAFLDNHPGIAKELQGNPNLVNDPNCLAQHPELKDFLEDHPGVRRELRSTRNSSCTGNDGSNGTSGVNTTAKQR